MSQPNINSGYDYTPLMPPALLENYNKAKKGDARAMYIMAEAFRTGIEIPRNSRLAIEWLRRSAEKHYPDAMYEYSHACKGNPIARVEWMRSAAEAGHRAAMYELAIMYSEGGSLQQDWPSCIKWMQKSAKKGYRKAKDYLGWAYFNGKTGERDVPEAIKWYTDAAEHGSVKSAMTLAEIYTFEDDYVDSEKAFFWYRFAAFNGESHAQTNLGYCYQVGFGTERDVKEAFRWSLEGATRGDARGMFIVGNNYRWGLGTKRNEKKAFEWMTRSALNGDGRGMDSLGVYYSNGIGTERDIVKALQWYEKSAEAGSSSGCTNAAWEYFKGFACKCNFRKAMAYCKKAVEISNSRAAIDTIGMMYFLGQGVKQNRRKAVEYFAKASDMGDFHGMRMYADILRRGIDVPADLDKAKELYLSDAENGDLASLENLMILGAGKIGKPEGPNESYSIAVHHILKGDAQKAVKKLLPAVKKGEEAECSLLGLIYLMGWAEGTLEEAEEHFRRALKGGNYLAGYYLGSILYPKDEDREFVLDCFKRGIDAGDERAMFYVGKMLYEGDGAPADRDQGIRWLVTAKEFGVEEASAYLQKEGIQ